jgi:hypothetical protein
VLATCLPAVSQITFVKGDNAIELSGVLNSYFRTFDPAQGNPLSAFDLRDARLVISGEHHPRFKYEFALDFAEVNDETRLDYFIIDANVNIDLPSGFDAYVGFQRLPISRNSNVSAFVSVFSRRPPMSGGALYNRRGMGVMFRKKMAHNRVNFHAGVFDSQGAVRNINGKQISLAYVARADFAFPARVRFEEVDVRHSPDPLFAVGLNFLYSQHSEEREVELFPLYLDGSKTLGAVDFAFMYEGVSVQAEVTRAWLQRDDDAEDSLPGSFVSQGMHVSVNYYAKSIKSVFAARFETFNPNSALYDAAFNVLTFGYNFLVDGSRDVVIRTDFRYFLNEDISDTPYNEYAWNLGFQFRF